MPTDCYRVDVIHYLNPSLIWVEVCDSLVSVDEFVFEQIGIYGIVPHETTIDIELESIVSAQCTDWVSAANTILKNLLCKSEEVWFLPTYIDRRSSIFDDNIHKYGELILKNSDGKLKKVSKYLVKSGFAEMNVSKFHSQLNNGELNTKLEFIQTQEVIKQLEKHYTKSSKKKEWEKFVRKQTSVFQMKQKFESELTVSNLEKHNNIMIKRVIENKSNDFELCKDVNEKPLGRGFHKADSIKSELKSKLLKKKTSYHDKTSFDDIKRFLDKNSRSKDEDTESSEPDHNQNGLRFLSGRLGKTHNTEQKVLAHDRARIQMAAKACDDSYQYDDHGKSIQKRFTKIKGDKKNSEKLVAFGPPDLDPFKMKVEKLPAIDHKGADQELLKEDCIDKEDFDKIDSDMSKHICDNLVHIDARASDSDQTVLSSVLQRRLKARVSVRNNESSISSSDTNTESSSAGENKESFDDDEVLEIIGKRYTQCPSLKVDNVSDSVDISLKNNVNPFKNVDSGLSVFVDKLVTPVLMVHSKSNKRIEPVFQMRDIHFNDHIRLVLRNMNVEKLMMVQTVSWNAILRGFSVFMVNPMGSGKTMGYLPAVCRLVSDGGGDISTSSGPMCIIVCATAKSVVEVERLAKMFLGLDERVVACYAGVDDAYITTALLNGCDLFISTPPALARLLRVNDFGIDLRRLSMYVLDDCERLTQTYNDELKFFQIKINSMLKYRVNKELKVQYIIASRCWCDFMAPLAKKAPDTIICIGAFQECVIYSKANTSVSFINSEKKLEHVFEFLETIDASKRTVIVCADNDEVEVLQTALRNTKRIVFACDNNMTVHDLYSLSESWADYQEPVSGPILVCCDGNLTHMNITDAHHLIHYSMPQYFSTFCKRFSVLNDNYPSIFKAINDNVKIKILLEESNAQQLPKIVNFIRRCTENLPTFLNDVCATINTNKDLMKAQKLVPLCDNLLQLGDCPDFYNCHERHTILKDADTPKEWVPRNGVITFKIIHYHTATLYSARLLTVTVNGTTSKFPQTYSTLSLKMGMYFANETHRKLHGMPEIGDICAVAMKVNFYARCQVLKILSRYQRGNPNKVLVRLVDEEKLEITRDIYLYYLPDDLKEIETKVVQVRLANLEPKDRDITFSDLARDHLKKLTDADDELFMRGQVSLAVGNCVFVTTLEACQDLSSVSEMVVKYNFKHELVRNHALINSEHLNKIEALCKKSGLNVTDSTFDDIKAKDLPLKNPQNVSWAHLDSEEMNSVFFASAINPGNFFVRLEKFESCMISLLEDIKAHVENNTEKICDIKEGDIVLAEFPDDSTYERARIDNVNGNRVKCFFVDQGDWREIDIKSLVQIPDRFLKKLPFQAIECRLVGVKPLGEEWTDFSTNWFHDNCFEGSSENLKYLFVKYFTKEPAKYTGGNKYGVVLIDTNTEQDVIINELMIDLNLARQHEEELKHFDNIYTELKKDTHKLQTDKEENCENTASETKVVSNSSIPQPIRSVPLINSDEESDDSDKWEVHISADNAAALFGTVANKCAITNSDSAKTPQTSYEMISPCERSKAITQELDSDDLTSPELSEISKTPVKRNVVKELDQKRHPKIMWHQNKSTIYVKIHLVVDNYDLLIDDRKLEFLALTNDIKYGFDLELFGVVKTENSTHVNKGQYVLVKLAKVLNKSWLTLTRNGDTKWVVYDVDFIDTSSDEEVVDRSSVMNIVISLNDNADTDTDDEQFCDDANFTYKK
ncbi:RNA helicase protein [Danaus plexippus plexippus]|uniref:RNA helicase n=1 Tax=Danaus plexippus plexippus TaxID=278856 RepID=A0A212F0W4_DANPL|nr:RNA helicase protein [Danaus plexippus plexippus]